MDGTSGARAAHAASCCRSGVGACTHRAGGHSREGRTVRKVIPCMHDNCVGRVHLPPSSKSHQSKESEWLEYLDGHEKLGSDTLKKAVDAFTEQMKPLQEALQSVQQRKAVY